MVSQSILTNITNFTISDQLNHGNNASNRISSISSNRTTTHEHDRSSESIEILDDDEHLVSKKKLKVSKNKARMVSRNNNSLMTTNETTESSAKSSQVWQYAIRCPNTEFSICCLCPNEKKISTNNGSTSTLRKHLITKHQKYELALPNNKRKRNTPSISNSKKQHLHDLFTKCIIRDTRTFNDLRKPGLKKILQELIPGKFFS